MIQRHLKIMSSLVILIFTLISCQSKKKQIDESAFTHMYKDSLELKMPHFTFDIKGALEIKVTAGEDESTIYLDNAYRAYQQEPDSIESLISQYLNASLSTLNPKSHVDRHLIVPVIKSYKYLQDLKDMRKDDQSLGDLIYYEPYNKDLVIVYAEDTEYNIRYLNRSEIDTLGIGLDTLQKFAYANLQKILPDVEIAGANGRFSVTAGTTYETSLILSKTMWDKSNFAVNGDIVIAIPTRDVLYVTGSNDKEMIGKLKTYAKEDYENLNYQVSPFLFVYDGKKFERYDN